MSYASNAGVLGLALTELDVAVNLIDLGHLHVLLRAVARHGDRDELGLEPRSGPFRAVLVLPMPVRGAVSHSHLVECILESTEETEKRGAERGRAADGTRAWRKGMGNYDNRHRLAGPPRTFHNFRSFTNSDLGVQLTNEITKC